MDYRRGPRRDQRADPDQYRVTQRNGTEPAFTGRYWDHHEPGIYVDVVSGEPLFALGRQVRQRHRLAEFHHTDRQCRHQARLHHAVPRREVRSAHADSHLGHVFKDGPATAAVCATASTPRRCGSSTATISRHRGTATMSACSPRRKTWATTRPPSWPAVASGACRTSSAASPA